MPLTQHLDSMRQKSPPSQHPWADSGRAVILLVFSFTGIWLLLDGQRTGSGLGVGTPASTHHAPIHDDSHAWADVAFHPEQPIRPPMSDTDNMVLASGAGTAEREESGHDRVLVMADMHGDINQAKATLRLLGAIDESGSWVGGRAVLVQTGDIVDRGPHSLATLDFFEALKAQAEAAGGKVVTLLGNHELMLLMGDTRYFSRLELARLAQESGASGAASTGRLASTPVNTRNAHALGLAQLSTLVAKTGRYGEMLRQRPLAYISHLGVGQGHGSEACSMLMIHAAALPWMVERANATLAAGTAATVTAVSQRSTLWDSQSDMGAFGQPQGLALGHSRKLEVAGDVPSLNLPPRLTSGLAVVDAWNAAVATALAGCDRQSCRAQDPLAAALLSGKGAVWDRSYITSTEEEVCESVERVTAALGVGRIVVGHTIVEGGRIANRCGGALLMLDLGVSSAYGGRPGDVVGLECRSLEATQGRELAETPQEVPGCMPVDACDADGLVHADATHTKDDRAVTGAMRDSDKRQWGLFVRYGGSKPLSELLPLKDGSH